MKIDAKKCNGCGLCVTLCPSRILSITAGKVKAANDECIGCGHCQAVCEQQAISVMDSTNSFSYQSFSFTAQWQPYGKGEIGSLVQLMHSRRSCRKYLVKEVPPPVLKDLARIATSAPSGTNSQALIFSVLETRDQVEIFGQAVADFYKRLNRMARKPFYRLFDRWLASGALAGYYHKHYLTVEESITAWEKRKEDRLFHGATAILAVGAASAASCPAEDAMLATQNILLAAHVMGLGTCLIGYAVEAISRDEKLKELLGIGKKEAVYAVIALGFPAVGFRSLIGKKDPDLRFPLKAKQAGEGALQ